LDGFTIIDFGVIVIIAVSALLAFSRGMVREGMAIAG
jgi:membrane protein required for colicin V production